MKTVLQHILRHKREYAQLPFFEFLRDDSFSARERLAFFPCMAPFIMSFGDLNRHVLRFEPTADPYLRLINAHTYEDDHHWPWYLEDFAKLGHDDPAQPISETLRFLYSEATMRSRLLSHRLAHLVWNAAPVVRLAIVEAIEETGNVLFALTSKLAADVERDTGAELRYCGEFHFSLETGHAMNGEHAELARIAMDGERRAEAFECVDLVFMWFAAWTQELLAYARTTQPAPELPNPRGTERHPAIQH